jgi:hypothetical protein|tara:strand:+ start:57 stop:425 length:369 start_codon:yes stop_codon:yes gene_type:complete
MAQSKATGSVVKPGHYNGSPLAGIQLDFGVDCSAKLAADGGVDVIIKAIMNEGLTPVAIGAVDATGGTGQGMKILFEGEHGTDTYDGSNSETLAAHLEDVVQAITDTDGITMSAVTVAAFDL